MVVHGSPCGGGISGFSFAMKARDDLPASEDLRKRMRTCWWLHGSPHSTLNQPSRSNK